MTANEGNADRAVRVVLGLIAIVAAYMWLGLADGAILGIVVTVIGAVMLLTGFVGFCPAYHLVGMSTCKKDCCGGSCETSTS
tara:strand:+ start:80928 stop:81173 length:246 start_codon:yes stop_codon:yes gene_type:complete